MNFFRWNFGFFYSWLKIICNPRLIINYFKYFLVCCSLNRKQFSTFSFCTGMQCNRFLNITNFVYTADPISEFYYYIRNYCRRNVILRSKRIDILGLDAAATIPIKKTIAVNRTFGAEINVSWSYRMVCRVPTQISPKSSLKLCSVSNLNTYK